MSGGALPLLLGVLGGEPRQLYLREVGIRSVWGIAYLVLSSLIGFSAYIWLLRFVSTARVSTYQRHLLQKLLTDSREENKWRKMP